MIFTISYFLSVNTFFSQNLFNNQCDSSEILGKRYIVGGGIGIKYLFPNSQNKTIDNNTSLSSLFEFGFLLGESRKNVVGVELKTYSYKHRIKGEYKPALYYITIFYRHPYQLLNNFYLSPEIGVTVFSNNLYMLLSTPLSLQVEYNYRNIGFFVKNTIFINLDYLAYFPLTTNVGVNIKL
ncbi:MAG: hypothetical protein IPM32_09205 [Ignavibacteriae bacterium]|nr:hypothetical protein [Ignavibacteriota bacterium]